MENQGALNILQYANAIRLRVYRRDRDHFAWIRAELKHMEDINGTNSRDIADIGDESNLLNLLVDILKSPDTDWMKYDSPGKEEWYVLPSLAEGRRQ